jgi:hypothetical protein
VKKRQKYEHGKWVKVKINFLFYGDNSLNVALRRMTFGLVKDHRHTYEA